MKAWPASRTVRRRGILAVAVLTVSAAGVVAFWSGGRRVYTFDDSRLLNQRPSRLFVDCRGSAVRAELGDNEMWRLPVPLERVAPGVVAATVAVEDRRFWTHRGIDWLAVGRAAMQNIRGGAVVSGASTLSMQLVRLAYPEPRGWGAKLRQAWRALDLEERRDKCWILEQYLNFAPYGGNIVGIQAAARTYFGKDASAVTAGEAALLAGLPQRPSALRPDRYPERAERRRRHVLQRMLDEGSLQRRQFERLLTDHTAERVLRHTAGRLGYPRDEEHFCRLAARESAAPLTAMTLDPALQQTVREALRERVRRQAGVHDGSAVIIDNATGHVLALVGTIDFSASRSGQVNAACAPRSPGSALKPFIYLLALEGGLAAPSTRLDDRPLRYADFRPGNFDGVFNRTVTVQEALVRSLNTPAVQLLERVGTGQLLQKLRYCGIRTLDRPAEHYGLALALGGGEVSLLELSTAYAALARGGIFLPSVFTPGQEGGAARRAFHAESVLTLTAMLSANALPGCGTVPLAWKTGTSNGFRDAWCLAYNQEVTIGVWLGNKDGAPAAGLVGTEAAAPVVADIAQALYRQQTPPPAAIRLPAAAAVALCAASGLRRVTACEQTFPGQAVAGIPLQACQACNGIAADVHAPVQVLRTPQILEPEPRVYLSDGEVLLKLATVDNQLCSWFADGRFLGDWAEPRSLTFGPGSHRIVCVAAVTRTTASVRFSVLKRQQN